MYMVFLSIPQHGVYVRQDANVKYNGQMLLLIAEAVLFVLL